MARFTLNIELGNETMQSGVDVAGALRRVARDVSAYSASELDGASGRIKDDNGNTVGTWRVDEEG